MPRKDGNIYHRGMELAQIAKSIIAEPKWLRKLKRELGVDEARRKSERTRKRAVPQRGAEEVNPLRLTKKLKKGMRRNE